MRQRRVRAAKAKMRGDLPQGGGEAPGVLFALDEAQYLLLSFGKLIHTGQMSSTRGILSMVRICALTDNLSQGRFGAIWGE
jgi:hypothetical protein